MKINLAKMYVDWPHSRLNVCRKLFFQVHVIVRCFNGPKRLTFKSAVSCACSGCRVALWRQRQPAIISRGNSRCCIELWEWMSDFRLTGYLQQCVACMAWYWQRVPCDYSDLRHASNMHVDYFSIYFGPIWLNVASGLCAWHTYVCTLLCEWVYRCACFLLLVT